MLRDSPYLHLLTRITPGPLPTEAAFEFLPWLFRWIALMLVLPVFLLLVADFTTYLYFRTVYQPWGRARTAFYKFPSRWGSRPASRNSSPPHTTTKLPDIAVTSDSDTDLAGHTTAGSASTTPPRDRSPSITTARASGIGMEGPVIDPASPGAEDVPLPMVSEEEETYWVG